MAQTVIENPVINSPYAEPQQHFRFTDEGITDEIVAGRRSSSYFIPIARPKKKGKQLAFDTEWTRDRIEENRLVNRIRERVKLWRQGGYVGLTSTTRQLLDYWTDPNREGKLFFCQIEALKPLSTSPRWPVSTVMPGWRIPCERPTTPQTPGCHGSPARWPRAPAKPW